MNPFDSNPEYEKDPDEGRNSKGNGNHRPKGEDSRKSNGWNIAMIAISGVSLLVMLISFLWGIPKEIHSENRNLRDNMDAKIENVRKELSNDIQVVRSDLSDLSEAVYRIEGLIEGQRISEKSGG
ncbi:MAG: hypothetical protein OXI35_11495 [Gemmatimonadota bacterium]|nr:hypothetical protein [Gemmatimonadota bacterium]